MIEKRVPPQHPAVGKPAIPHPQVDLGPLVGTVHTALGKYQLVLLLMQGNQQLKPGILERKLLVRIQLHPGSTELIQPLLYLSPDRPGGHSTCQRRGGLAVRVAPQKSADPRGQPGRALGLGIT